MQLSRRSLLAFTALSFSLTPMLAQAQPRAPRAGNSAQSTGRFDGLATLRGTVSRRIDNNQFELRVGGATFGVRSQANARVKNGDRVTLRGTFRSNDAFTAQTVRIFGDDNYDGDGYSNNSYDNGSDYDDGDFDTDFPRDNPGSVNFPATLTRVISTREIEVRGDNGRVYRVATLKGSSGLRVGERLRVRGQSSGPSRIVGAQILRENGGYDEGDYEGPIAERNVDFPARIVRLDKTRNEATVRGENGRDYLIRGAEVDKFQTGDRVRVRGEATANVVELDRLDLVI